MYAPCHTYFNIHNIIRSKKCHIVLTREAQITPSAAQLAAIYQVSYEIRTQRKSTRKAHPSQVAARIAVRCCCGVLYRRSLAHKSKGICTYLLYVRACMRRPDCFTGAWSCWRLPNRLLVAPKLLNHLLSVPSILAGERAERAVALPPATRSNVPVRPCKIGNRSALKDLEMKLSRA